MKTTLNKIREHALCEESWGLLLESLNKTKADDEELTIKYILDMLGVEDAIWALRAVEGYDREIRLFACDCADSVLHLFESESPEDKRPRIAIEVACKYANGEVDEDTLAAARAARAAAWAARAAARNAARVARAAARDAAWAARAVAWAARAARAAWEAGDAAWAARDAAWAARAAARNAARAARAAWEAGDAGDAEKVKQKEFLLKYL